MRIVIIKYQILAVIIFLAFFSTQRVQAQEPPELKEVLDDLKSETGKVEEFKQKEGAVLESIEAINQQIVQTRDELNAHQTQLLELTVDINLLEKDIEKLQNQIVVRKNSLKDRLALIYKQNRGDRVSILISSKKYQELLKRVKYLNLLMEHDRRLIKEFMDMTKELNDKTVKLRKDKATLETLTATLEEKTGKLRKDRQEKEAFLKTIQEKKEFQETLVSDLKQSADDLFLRIREEEKAKGQYENMLAESVKTQEQTESSIEKEETEDKGEDQPENADETTPKESKPDETKEIDLKKSKFEELKGKLPWPVNGEILTPFGSQDTADFNLPALKNGVLINGSDGESVRSISKGSVVYATWFKGYGKLLIINHGNGYHSLYGHLTDIFLKPGQQVEIMQDVGKVGDSGISNTPGLYFEIRHKGKPLNPLEWLKEHY